MSGMQHQRKQAGMISILVTMLLLVVISLIVLGFAQISRRNQRESTDRQLSTQAFYAAEAGVNDARNLIKNALANGTAIPPKTDCTNGSGAAAVFYSSLNPTLDATNNVSYTCLMVNPNPSTLHYDDIGIPSKTIPLSAASGSIAKATFTWKTKDSTTTPANGCPISAGVLRSTTSWTASNCGYGVLRVDIVPTNGVLTMNGLQNNTMTSFFVPLRSGGVASVAYPGGSPASSRANNRVGAACTNTSCTMSITGLNSPQYYLRVSSIYKDVSLDIAINDSANNPLNTQGAQAIIDATGKAQDVLRRMQVRVPLTATSVNLLSDYAIESTDAICKRFAALDGYFQSYASSAVSGFGSITTPPNPLCQ